jgi:hypothetical protein
MRCALNARNGQSFGPRLMLINAECQFPVRNWKIEVKAPDRAGNV